MARASHRSSLTIRAVIGLALVTVIRLAEGADSCGPADLGCAIFSGQHAVAAHLRDDDRMLPAAAARCINCHSQAGAAAAFAPPLTPRYLLSYADRRGGPPSRYNSVVFCRVLEDGIDPAGIVLKKSMPHYTLSDTECAALWRFFTGP